MAKLTVVILTTAILAKGYTFYGRTVVVAEDECVRQAVQQCRGTSALNPADEESRAGCVVSVVVLASV